MSTTKYYFGWYNYHGKWFCERFAGDLGKNFCERNHRTEITQTEWEGPLDELMVRYASLRPDGNSS